MHKYAVTTTQEIEADTVEEAALLMYQALTKGPAPLHYSVTDDRGQKIDFDLDREQAVEFANLDHTADPGNW
jgi:penicillin V acylase-like amidase (Ntn superfamily)